MQLRFTRVLLKLSGEALAGSAPSGIDPAVLERVAGEIVEIHRLGCSLGIVIGGGNILRGVSAAAQGADRAAADMRGMLATVFNALAMQEMLRRLGVEARVLSAIEVPALAEPCRRQLALEHLEAGRIVLFAGGTGNPFFTTDTAAALRALEIGAGALFKATKVDGVYDKDPKQHPDAIFLSRLTYDEVLLRNLAVMDATAVSLCREHRLPVLVFNLFRPGTMKRAVLGESVGTLVAAS